MSLDIQIGVKNAIQCAINGNKVDFFSVYISIYYFAGKLNACLVFNNYPRMNLSICSTEEYNFILIKLSLYKDSCTTNL